MMDFHIYLVVFLFKKFHYQSIETNRELLFLKVIIITIKYRCLHEKITKSIDNIFLLDSI